MCTIPPLEYETFMERARKQNHKGEVRDGARIQVHRNNYDSLVQYLHILIGIKHGTWV